MPIFQKPLWPVYLRVILGISWCGAALKYVIHPYEVISAMEEFVHMTPFAFGADLLNNVFIPSVALVTPAVILGNLIVGISLTLGLFISTGCLVGMFMSLIYIIALPFTAIFNIPLIICKLIVLFSVRSRKYSLDEKIFKRFQISG